MITKSKEIQRIFIPGDSWLYYKIYSGARSSDTILTDIIAKISSYGIEQNWISHWFFIRYADPDTHLRVRFYVKDPKNLEKIMFAIKQGLQPYVADEIIHKVQIDTYQRELERYSKYNIETSEKLFFKESTVLVKSIETIKDDTNYFFMIIKMIDSLLTLFSYSLEEKLKICVQNGAGYKKEFQSDKRLTKQLDAKYRTLKTRCQAILKDKNTSENENTIFRINSEYVTQMEPILSQIQKNLKNYPEEVSKNSLVSSYVHMLVNRAFRSKQRFFELVCYDFLEKFYKEEKFRK